MLKNALFAAPLAALATVGLMAAAAPSPASAAEKAVRYDDLNLATIDGQKQLERRLTAAAKEVCEFDMITTGTHIPSAESRTCYKQAKASSKQQMAAIISSKQFAAAE